MRPTLPAAQNTADGGASGAGLVTLMFGAAGTLFNVSKRAQNQMKVRRAGRSRARP